MAESIVVNQAYAIEGDELHATFVRSSGPGGQNVNKVNTKAVLRWHVASAAGLPGDVRRRLVERYANRMNNRGEIVVSSDQSRHQARNLHACREKLRGMVAAAWRPPKPRIKTRPTRASVERRLEQKRQKGRRKSSRRYRPGRDD